MEKSFIKNYVLMTLIALRQNKDFKFSSDSLLFKSSLTKKDCVELLTVLTQACVENNIKPPCYICTSNYNGTYNLTIGYDIMGRKLPNHYDEEETIKTFENEIPD